MWPNGRGELLAGLERARPSYARLVSLLQGVPGSRAARTWVDRVNPFTRGLGSVPVYEREAGGAFYGEALDSYGAGARGSPRVGHPALAAQGAPAPAVLVPREGSAGLGRPGSAEGGAGGAGSAVAADTVSIADAQAAARAATDATRFGEVDIITGQPVRDLKMEPVMALRRWLRASGASGSFDEDVKPNSLQ